jgi:hypothetical protein
MARKGPKASKGEKTDHRLRGETKANNKLNGRKVRLEQTFTINSVCGDPGYELLLIVSYHFLRKAKSEPIRDAYYSTLIAVGPE